ncbi:membrane protein [Litchfieldella qijiaojingensis]|uniref:Membrane protein n=1 Tax=Litchfieldella qijiaojingensis TaxID=980347 RepID=A0ABQ2YYC5_9GAMM|nr:membrane protein [Halomonas qijiaojingensis]
MAHAHPHGWIDLGVRVILDDQGRVEALRQRWRMDPFYSLVILEELEAAEGDASMEARLDQLGTEIRDNLAPRHYFTELTHAGQQVALGEVSEYTVMERGGRVEFSFLLPLEAPLALEGEVMRYQVFDPSYYLEVVHEAGDDETPLEEALVVVGSDLACTTSIEPADPDPAKVAEAAMLDYDDQAEPGLGRYFAETGEVACDG